MALTTAEKLSIASISEYFSFVDIKKKGLYGGGVDLLLPQKIYAIKKSIEYWYNLNPSDTTLVTTSNYLLALCGYYGAKAQHIITNSGTIPGTVARTAPLPYQFTVDASTSFIIDGESSKTITAFMGYNLIFVRGGITQSTVNAGDGSSYYSWSKTTGTFTCFPAAVTSELFGLFPV